MLLLGLCFGPSLCGQTVVTAGQLESASALISESSAPAGLSVAALNPTEGIFNLDIAVSGPDGEPVFGLTREDFTVLDEGQPAKVRSFHAFDKNSAKPDPPVGLILLIDTLNVTAQQARQSESEVEKFLTRNEGRLAQPTSVYVLSDTGLSSTGEPSTDGKALAAAVARPTRLPMMWRVADDWQLRVVHSFSSGALGPSDPSNGAELFRNLLSLKALGAIALQQREKTGRKMLIWLGPGWPVAKAGKKPWGMDSFDWIVQFSTRLREARIALYRATTRPPPHDNDKRAYSAAARSSQDVNPLSLSLEVLSTQSGGLSADRSDELAGVIDRCLEDATTFYTISFDPPPAHYADEYRGLSVRLSRPELLARARTGYYDEPVYYDRPGDPVKPVTVAQSKQLLNAPGSSDTKVASTIAGTVLTERLRSGTFSTWKGLLPGPEAWAALVAMADASSFLDPPAAEIGEHPAPSVSEREGMLSRTRDYLKESVAHLPDFFATRTTTRYEERGEQAPKKGGPALSLRVPEQSLEKTTTNSETVLYRDGREVVEEKKPQTGESDLETRGTFGPILTTVIEDSSHGSVTWGYWLHGQSALVAVFRYVVPKGQSHYEVAHCCLSNGDGTGYFQSVVGYHGEFTIDPATGAILRVTVQANLEPKQPPTLPLIRSDIMVEYGPVEIGGKAQICPLRSVSISRGRTIMIAQEFRERLESYGRFETVLGDVSFTGYHMFGAEVRVLPGYNPAAK